MPATRHRSAFAAGTWSLVYLNFAGAFGPYRQLPWRLGLLTQTNSTC
jgi:hypothetical protein